MTLKTERPSHIGYAVALMPAVIALAACSNGPRLESGSGPGPTIEVGRARSSIVGGRPVEPDEFSGVLWLDSGCTATLIHPRVVVFGAHCGLPTQGVWAGDRLDLEFHTESRTVEVREYGGELLLPVHRCGVNPSADIGNGRDLAYCILEEHAADLSPLPLIGDNERNPVTISQVVSLVGFGFDSELEDPTTLGTKRVTTAPIRRIGFELEIGDESSGTCAGDSGGPALMGGQDEGWRLLGVLSSGEVDLCGEGRYTDIHRFTAWLEEETGMEFTSAMMARSSDPAIAPALDTEGETYVRGPSCGVITGARHRNLLQCLMPLVTLLAALKCRFPLTHPFTA